MKPLLKDFNTKFYSDIQQQVLGVKEDLSRIQEQCALSPGDGGLMEAERASLLKYVDLSSAEEALNRKKSRIRRLKLGDILSICNEGCDLRT
ncbi:hypothetical protein RHMOL_Rhmol03G0148600 [Rhododendron molle]|uniref:Uncharacterized protein n=1 Tax=Rhododendron molle TaxID=49168 RepID=A0ACC0PE79_RHOML|nr:hypothetical protein RHMOL_Rhmol03G0148600 [Rhododendron molle]